MTRLGDKAVQDHDHVYVHDHDQEHVVVNVGVDVIVNVAGFQNPRFRSLFPNDLAIQRKRRQADQPGQGTDVANGICINP